MSQKNMTEDARTQWHPAFVAAMNLELRQNRADLIYEKEYNLNTKPLSIDLLVLKKTGEVPIENEIGRIFRGHNILEYKSEDDHLDIDVFYKVGSYASLYKAYGERVDSVKADDVTVSLIRKRKPEGLFRHFKKSGTSVRNPYPGIFFIEGEVLFPTQIVVVRELDKASHVWLTALSGKLEKQDIAELLDRTRSLREKAEMEYADSVLQVSITANKRVVDDLKGQEKNMCQALLEIMEPEINQIKKEVAKEVTMEVTKEVTEEVTKAVTKEVTIEVTKEVTRKDVAITVKTLRDLGQPEDFIREIIIRNFELRPADADEILIAQ